MTELHFRVLHNIGLNLAPIPLVVADLFTGCAYGQKPPKGPNLAEGEFQLLVPLVQMFHSSHKGQMSLDRVPEGLEKALGLFSPFAFFGVNSADGSENLTVRPENGIAEVGKDAGFR